MRAAFKRGSSAGLGNLSVGYDPLREARAAGALHIGQVRQEKWSMRSPQPYRRSTAYHEAGHAVIAMVEGTSLGDVSIIPDGSDRGRTALPLPDGFDPMLCDDVERRAVVEPWISGKLAGAVAERAAMGQGYRVRGGRNDREQAEEGASWVTLSDREARFYLRWLTARVDELVAREWPAIERLAAHLLLSGASTGSEAREVAFG
jgi:ATP-dependent Zn proteases